MTCGHFNFYIHINIAASFSEAFLS